MMKIVQGYPLTKSEILKVLEQGVDRSRLDRMPRLEKIAEALEELKPIEMEVEQYSRAKVSFKATKLLTAYEAFEIVGRLRVSDHYDSGNGIVNLCWN